VVRSILSGDPGLGVKSLSKAVVAGSPRNASWCSLVGGLREGRVTDREAKGRKIQLCRQTPNLLQP
jgi:hypothetical protein